MSEAQDPCAWRVAVALAQATGLDWGAWASGAGDLVERKHQAYSEELKRCHAADFPDDLAESYAELAMDEVVDPCPVLAPWDTEAYLADCRRREVEPGPLPSLRHNGEVFWAVGSRKADPAFVTYIQYGVAAVEVLNDGNVRVFNATSRNSQVTFALDGLVRVTNLARVAAEAMGR